MHAESTDDGATLQAHHPVVKSQTEPSLKLRKPGTKPNGITLITAHHDEERLQRVVGLPLAEELARLLLLLLDLHPGRRRDEVVEQHSHAHLRERRRQPPADRREGGCKGFDGSRLGPTDESLTLCQPGFSPKFNFVLDFH